MMRGGFVEVEEGVDFVEVEGVDFVEVEGVDFVEVEGVDFVEVEEGVDCVEEGLTEPCFTETSSLTGDTGDTGDTSEETTAFFPL